MTEETKGIGELSGIVIDVQDLDKAECFWTVILGGSVMFKDSQYVAFDSSPRVALQKVAEVKTSKNRMHLDIRVLNIEVAAEQVVSAGGSRLRNFDAEGFLVMADPDGNEFCLVRRRG